MSVGRSHRGRLLSVALVSVFYIFLLAAVVFHFVMKQPNVSFALLSWVRFGVSAFIALLFLAVGSIVWLFARDRVVAGTLFGYCASMMTTFAVLPGGQDPLFTSVSTASSALAVLLLLLFLLLFPHNFLSAQDSLQSPELPRQGHLLSSLLLRGYLSLMTVWCLAAVLLAMVYWQSPTLPSLVQLAIYPYFPVGLFATLVTAIASSRRARSLSLRQRQQLRLFIGGVIVAVSPLLILTALPLAFRMPALDGQISALPVGLLPLAIGYSVLRYQLLILDRYVRQITAWIVGAVAVALLGYLAVALPSLFLLSGLTYVVCAVALCVVLGPSLWWLAGRGTELLFPEARYYRRLLEQPHRLSREVLDLSQAAQVLVEATLNTFQTDEVCVFVRAAQEEEKASLSFQLYPPLAEDDSNGASRRTLLHRLHPWAEDEKGSDRLTLDGVRQQRMATSERPLLLSELDQADGQTPIGLARYFTSPAPFGGIDPVLAPVRAQGELIGMLVLGERGDQQQYSGLDFEIIQGLLDRFSPILETARIMRRLRAALERQEELDRLKDQFIITASHELRTPLTAVQGYIELLAEYNGILKPEAQADFIAKASRGCDELTLMVGNIMDASRMHIDVQNVKLSQVLLSESVQHVLEITEAMTTRERRQVQVDVPVDTWVMADDFRLRQILLNLVGNALKYSPAGSRIEISAKSDASGVTVSVRDHGLGVPKREQEHLFERFVRLERDMNSPVRGAGLGLYISKQLVEAMGGSIWIESSGVEGEGSTFVFVLSHARLEEKDEYPLKRQQA